MTIRRSMALLALLLCPGLAGADDAPPPLIVLKDHTIKDEKGDPASILRNVRMTFVRVNPASEFRFDYSVEWDITNVTHNVTGRGVNGPDSKIYLRLHTGGERRIGILLAGRSRCDTKHLKATFGFKTLAETKARITLSDNGVVGPQAPC